jgi:hypothetical protein
MNIETESDEDALALTARAISERISFNYWSNPTEGEHIFAFPQYESLRDARKSTEFFMDCRSDNIGFEVIP